MQVCNFNGERSDCFIAYLGIHIGLLAINWHLMIVVPGVPFWLVFSLVPTGELIVKKDDHSARPYISFPVKLVTRTIYPVGLFCGLAFRVWFDALQDICSARRGL